MADFVFPRMPAAFIGHGNPMNALESNLYTTQWRKFGETLPRPRAILVISAHWCINNTAITAMARPRTIHDFHGFPQALFDFQYPAPGAPIVAQEIAELLKPNRITLDTDSWGIDHGAWSVLTHIFPQADIPVLQLSIHAQQNFAYHFELGKKLALLRDQGVFVLGSGNVVHNLGLINWNLKQQSFDWAQDFDAQVRNAMTTNPQNLIDVLDHPAYALAVPTPEHFLPLVYIAGMAATEERTCEIWVEGGAMGSLTMTSFVLGVG